MIQQILFAALLGSFIVVIFYTLDAIKAKRALDTELEVQRVAHEQWRASKEDTAD